MIDESYQIFAQLLLEGVDFNDPCLVFKISPPNAKIEHYNFSLRSGYTCPFAKKCLAKVKRNPKTRKSQLIRGPESEYQCFSASQELTYPDVYLSREYNEKLTMARLSNGGPSAFAKTMITALSENLPRSATHFRIHVGGDFFNKSYLSGWILVAKAFPDVVFYAYTKSYPYFRDLQLPSNFLITHSLGGSHDDEIKEKGLKFAQVVMSPEEAANYVWKDKAGVEHVGLEIDHDDTHAYKDDKPFALLIHGMQAAGSPASKAVSALKKRGIKPGYGDKKQKKKLRLPTGELPDEI
jgi:hypothetical protein